MTIEQINKESAEKIAKDFPIKKQERTPRNYDSILKGALALSFGERVELKKALHKSIEDELTEVKNVADQYLKLAKE